MATGSHATYGGWEEKICGGCGKRTTLKDPGTMYYFDHATKTAKTTCDQCLKQGDVSPC